MSGLLRKVRAAARKLVRRSWMKFALRGVGGSDNYAGLDRAYSVEDPWNLESNAERARFAETDRVAGRAFGHVGSLLEIGCGEGHQTDHFAQLADQVYGLDVSATAIERARRRVPAAQFAAVDVFAQPWGDAKGRFDVVTACEVLYYLKDPAATLARMRYLGRACLVTVFAPGARKLGALLDDIEGVRKDWGMYGDQVWFMWWWRND